MWYIYFQIIFTELLDCHSRSHIASLPATHTYRNVLQSALLKDTLRNNLANLCGAVAGIKCLWNLIESKMSWLVKLTFQVGWQGWCKDWYFSSFKVYILLFGFFITYFLIGGKLLYYVVLVSAVQQSESVEYIYMYLHVCVCMAEGSVKSLQSCPTLCDPVDCSPPTSSVHGILQARMEWVAFSFFLGIFPISNYVYIHPLYNIYIHIHIYTYIYIYMSSVWIFLVKKKVSYLI